MSKKEKELELESEKESENAQEPEAKSEAKKEPITWVYCGPDIPKYGIKKYRVYNGGLPLYFTNTAILIPVLMRLVVPYDELESMREKCATKGTPEYEYYERVRSFAAVEK